MENTKSLESTLNRATLVGSPLFMMDYDFAYHYYYSVKSSANEYSSYVMSLRTPSFIFPTAVKVGRKFGGTFLQVGGEFWGSYRDYVGDYQGDVLTLLLAKESSIVGEFGVEAFYTHFQRSAYIGSYPVDTGEGGSTVVDFYEEWIYRDGFGMKFTRYGEDYNLSGGFSYMSADRVVPLFLEFKKLLGSSTIHFRQTAFWGSTILPPKLHIGYDREFVMGRRSLYLSLFTGILLRPSEVFGLKRPPISGLSLKYVSYFPSGELTLMGRGYATKADKNEVGGEAYIAYRFARRWRPKPFAGFIYAGDVRGPYLGVSFGTLGRRFYVAYYHAHKAVSLGLEVSYGVFAL